MAWAQALSGSLSSSEFDLVTTIFPSATYQETRQFSVLHKIVLGLMKKDLRYELECSTSGINAVDSSGRTCLSWAAARGDVTALECLMDFGADPNLPDLQGCSPLQYVKDIDCCRLLVSHGACVNARDSAGCTALHKACSGSDDISVAQCLLSSGADINAATGNCGTALMHASLKGNAAIATLLLRQGADASISDDSGNRALHLAVIYNGHATLPVLLARQNDCDCTAQNAFGQNILHLAARLADRATLKLLNNADLGKLDIGTRDIDGLTAAELADARLAADDQSDTRTLFHELLDHVAHGSPSVRDSHNRLHSSNDEKVPFAPDKGSGSVVKVIEIEVQAEDVVDGTTGDAFYDALERLDVVEVAV